MISRSRRNLVKLGLLASSSLAMAPARSAHAALKRVLVVGAGASGLAAAHLLHTAGYPVTVIEGRDRLGGRIWTDRGWDGAPMDLGASWIHGAVGNPVADLASQFGIRTTEYDVDRLARDPRESPTYNATGQLLSLAAVQRLTAVQDLAGAALEQAARHAGADVSALDAIQLALAGLDASEAEKARSLELFRRQLEDGLGADLEEVAARGLSEGRAFTGPDMVFPNGYGQLVERLAAGLDIRLGHRVTHVRHDAGGVRIFTTHGAFSGDVAIVTLPLGVLKEGRVTFSPGLTPGKQAAIARLGMGVYDKAVFLFPTPFWKEVAMINQLHTENGMWATWYALDRYAGKPILCALQGGTPARRLEEMPRADVLADAMRHLRSMFGSGIPAPIDFRVTRWLADPFARGSYSFPKVGGGLSDRDALAAPENGRLLFAGEATHADYSATVHGAVLSGWREASRVMRQQA